jgi:hypothetical protein
MRRGLHTARGVWTHFYSLCKSKFIHVKGAGITR